MIFHFPLLATHPCTLMTRFTPWEDMRAPVAPIAIAASAGTKKTSTSEFQKEIITISMLAQQ